MTYQALFDTFQSLLAPYRTLCMLFCFGIACMVIVTVIGKRKREQIVGVLRTVDERGSALHTAGKVILLLITFFSWFVLGFLLLDVLQGSALQVLKVIAYLVIYLTLPGYLLIRRVRQLPHASLLFALCVASGMGMMFLVFLAGSLLGVMSLVKFVPPLLAAAAAVLLYRDIRSKKLDRKLLTIDLPLLALTSLLLAYAVLVRGVGSSPLVDGSGYTFMDSLYVVSNSAAMKNGLMQESFLFPGFYLRYHSMTNIQQACAGIVTGISAVDLFTVYWPLIYLSMALSAIHGLICLLKNNTVGVDRMTALVVLSQTFTLGNLYLFDTNNISMNLYMGTANLEAYLLRLPNGNDIAIPMILCVAAVCILYYRNACEKRIAFTLAAVMMCMCTGAKAAYALCILGALVGTGILMAIFQKKNGDLKKTWWLLGAAVLGFVAAYAIMIYNPTQSAVSTVTILDPYDPRSSLKFESLYPWLKTRLESLFPAKEFSETVLLLLAFPLSVFIILPYAIIPFFVGFVQKAARIKTIKSEQMLMYGTAVCALLAYYLVNIDGYSQAYFLLAGLCFIHIMGQLWLSENHEKLPYVMKLLVAFCLLLSLFSTGANINSSAYTAIAEIAVSRVYPDMVQEPSYDSITEKEYEVLCWLKENSPEDSLIVTDRLLTSQRTEETMLDAIERALYFYYPAYSERQFYISGYSYSPRTEEMSMWIEERLQVIETLYNSATVNRAAIMREHGITHMMVSRFMTPDFNFSSDPTISCIYGNPDLMIYVPVE